MRLHQLNFKFDPGQDRLLLRINTSTQLELRVWLTRRLTVGVLPLLRKLIVDQVAKAEALESANGNGATVRDPKIRELLGEIKKDTILKTSDFETPFKEQANQAATAEPADDAVLVSEMALTPLTNGHLKIKFTGKPIGSSQIEHQARNVEIDLDERLMHGFLHLLEKSYAASEWSKTTVAPIDSDPASNPAADAGRPRYLN